MSHKNLQKIILFHLRACANDKAHNRRYDAVCDMVLSTYSIVWIADKINTSPIDSSSPCPPAGGAFGLGAGSTTFDVPSSERICDESKVTASFT